MSKYKALATALLVLGSVMSPALATAPPAQDSVPARTTTAATTVALTDETYFDDFEDGTADGWSDGSVTNGRLEITPSDTTAEWTDVPGFGPGSGDDWRMSMTIDPKETAIIELNGPPDKEIYVSLQNGDVGFFEGDVNSDTEQSVDSYTQGNEQQVKLEYNNSADELRLKVWQRGTDEPATWEHTETAENTFSDGQFRVITQGSDNSVFIEEVEIDFANIYQSVTVSGTVKTRNGEPCSDCVVKSYGYNYNSFSGTKAEIDEQVEELRSELQNAAPSSWKPDLSLTGSGGQFSDANGKYVAAHPKSGWGLQGYDLWDLNGKAIPKDFDGLRNPTVTLPAHEGVLLSIWDTGSGDGVLEDNVDGKLPGATTDGKVVIKQLGPRGDTISTSTKEAENLLGTGRKVHKAVKASFSPGFYKIYPKSNPGAAYVVVAGDPDSIKAQFQQELKNELGQLSEYQQRLNEKISNNKIKPTTTTTDGSGRFELKLDSQTLKQTTLIAYDVPSGMGSINPDNPPNRSDIREYYEGLSISDLKNADSYATPDPSRSPSVSVPSDSVTVGVVETSLPTYSDINRSIQRAKQLAEELLGTSWSELAPGQRAAFLADSAQQLRDRYGNSLDSTPEETKEKLVDDIKDVKEGQTDVSEAVKTLAENITGGTDRQIRNELFVDYPEQNTTALQQRIAALETTVADVPSEIELVDTTSTSSADTVSSTFNFGGEIPTDNVSVVAEWANGTTTAVSDDYIAVDQSLGTAVGQGATTVRVEEFPIGETDPGAVTLRVRGLSVNGKVGRGAETLANPATNAEIPSLRALSFNTLAPEAGTNFTATVSAPSDSSFQKVASAQVYAPNGTALSTTVSNGDEITATAAEAGIHKIEYVVQTTDGETFTERTFVEARSNSIDRPATARATETAFGVVAQVGDGFVGGSAARSESGDKVTISGTIDSDADVPTQPHYYADSIALDRKTTIETTVLRGENRKQVSESVGVVIHTRPIPDNAHVYRTNGETIRPITPDGSAYGSYNTTGDGSYITTFGDGGATVTIVKSPTLTEEVTWFVRTTVPGGNIVLNAVPTAPLAPLLALVAGLPAMLITAVWRRRGDSE